MESQNYIELKNLEVYKLSRQLSTIAWKIYCRWSFDDKRHIGDQFLRSVDSINDKASILQVKLNNFITITTKKGRENHEKI